MFDIVVVIGCIFFILFLPIPPREPPKPEP
jgi:hypothetical protein